MSRSPHLTPVLPADYIDDQLQRKQRHRGIIREDRRSKALLLREGGLTNAEIASALGCAHNTVIELIGPQPPHLHKLHGRKRPHQQRSPLTDEERAQGRQRRQCRQAAYHTAATSSPDDAQLLRLLSVVGSDEVHGCDSIDVPLLDGDLRDAVRTAYPGKHVRVSAGSVEMHSYESDDTCWRDEEEPEMPVVPRNTRHYARYAYYHRQYADWNRQLRLQLAKRHTAILIPIEEEATE